MSVIWKVIYSAQHLPKLLKVIITKALQSALSSSTDHHLSLSLTMCVSVCFLSTVFWFLFPCWHTCSPFTDYCPAAIKHFLSIVTRSFPCIVAKMLRPCSDFHQCYLLVICHLMFSHVCFSTLHEMVWFPFLHSKPSLVIELLYFYSSSVLLWSPAFWKKTTTQKHNTDTFDTILHLHRTTMHLKCILKSKCRSATLIQGLILKEIIAVLLMFSPAHK